MRLTPSSLVGRKEQVTHIINLIFIGTGVIFIIHDFFSDFLVDGFWSAGSIRQVELILSGAIVILLLRMKFIAAAKLITSTSLIVVFFVSPIFISLNYLEMYYINTLLLPVIVLIPSMVYDAHKQRTLILSLFVVSILANFACEQVIFRSRTITSSDLTFYNYHFVLFSLAKLFTSLFIYLNITHLFRQNETFELKIVNANDELNRSNQLVNSQKQRIEEQNTALRKSEAELKSLDVAKSNFFANISHEFRTPLTLLHAPLGELIRESTDPAEKDRLALMKHSTSRLLNLVNQLLDLSRLESGSLKLEASHADITAFIKRLTAQFHGIADSRKIEFKIDAPEKIFLWFDPDKVEKIITNILANAFKFTPDGGVVSLVIREIISNKPGNDGVVEIEISDSGIGIEEDKLVRIFDRFYQVSDSSQREFEGTGIGLALAKEMAAVHRGDIRVFSRPAQGSIFTLSLPLGKAHFKDEELVETPIEYQTNEDGIDSMDRDDVKPILLRHSEEAAHVLIVEDNAEMQNYLANSLSNNFKVSFAVNGLEGIDMALAEQPDVIVTDLMMPKVDGMQLVRQIKSDERTSHIPVVLLTAKADRGTRLEGIESGADDYVAKPFELAELRARIQNLIESRRLLREKYSVAKVIRPNDIKVESLDDQFLKKVLLSIEAHLSDEQFGVSVLAEDIAVSNIQLYRKLKAVIGKTPNDLIKNMRLDRARSLLEQKRGNVSEIAAQVGFRNMSYFARSMKERFGMSPSEMGNP
jgi:signal transduction histidine kinase/DNA-binding response OmpR family regulator